MREAGLAALNTAHLCSVAVENVPPRYTDFSGRYPEARGEGSGEVCRGDEAADAGDVLDGRTDSRVR